jgi:hypothetical protein
MSALITVRPDVSWDVSGGLFDWILEYLIPRMRDPEAAARLRETLDNHFDMLSLSEFSPGAQQEIVSHLREGLIEAAQRELPDSDVKEEAVEHLRELVRLTYD